MRSLNGESLEVSFIEYSSYREVVWIAHDTSILISSMILRYVNLVMTIRSQKSFTLNHHLSAVEKYLRKSYSNLSPIHGYGSAKGMTLSQDTDCLIPKLLGLGSAILQNYPLTKGKYYVRRKNRSK